LKHELPTWFVEFSPDGRHLLTAGRDRVWRLWDLATQWSSIEWHRNLPFQQWFTKESWNALTNLCFDEQHFPDLRGHRPLAISPSGRWILTWDGRGEARLRDIATGEPVSAPIRCKVWFGNVEFSPDGTRLAISSEDHAAQVWEVPTGRPITPPLQHRLPVWKVTFSPQGTSLACAARKSLGEGGGEARIWDISTGQLAAPVLEHAAAVSDIAFSPDGRLVATASGDETTERHAAQLWDSRTGQRVGPAMPHENQVSAVVFSNDGRWLATAGSDAVARVWEVATFEPTGPPLKHAHGLASIAFSSDSRLVATSSSDGAVRVWEWSTGERVTPDIPLGATLRGITFSPCDNHLVVEGYGGIAAILPVAPDPRPLTLLQDLATLASGTRLKDRDMLEFLATDEILALCDRLRRARVIGPLHDLETAVRWHRARALAAEQVSDLAAAGFHHDMLRRLNSEDHALR
jgi:WD40 repeat protein